MRTFACVSVTGVLLSGCVAFPIPHDRLATPVVEGTVVDSRTKAPVAGARITVASTYGGAHATVTSDASGKFRAYASTQASWYYFTLLNIEGVCEGQFSVESDGYRASAFTAKYFNWGGIDGLCSSTPIQRSVELDRDG